MRYFTLHFSWKVSKSRLYFTLTAPFNQSTKLSSETSDQDLGFIKFIAEKVDSCSLLFQIYLKVCQNPNQVSNCKLIKIKYN